MTHDSSSTAFGLIVIGTLLSLGRERLSLWYAVLFTRLSRRPADQTLRGAVRLYLMITGMVFTVAGLLGLVGVLPL